MKIRNFTIGTIGGLFLALSGPVGAWVVDNNYDSDTLGASICGDNIPAGYREKQAISNEKSFSGPHSCKYSVREGKNAFGAEFNHPKLVKGDELWFQFKMFVPEGFDLYVPSSSGGRLKFISISTFTADGVSKTFFVELTGGASSYASALTYDTSSPFWHKFGSGKGPVRGVWETYEIYMKFDNVAVDSGGTGRLRMWKNNELIGDVTNQRTLNSATDNSPRIGFFTYWNGNSPKTQHLYIDDVLATNQTPTNTDENGNTYIGGAYTGGIGNTVATTAPPLPPSTIQ